MTEEEVNRIMATPRKQAKKYVPPNMRGQGSIPGLGKPKWGWWDDAMQTEAEEACEAGCGEWEREGRHF